MLERNGWRILRRRKGEAEKIRNSNIEMRAKLSRNCQIFNTGQFPRARCVQVVFSESSFPHALSGNPGESGAGPPIKTFGRDAFEMPCTSAAAELSGSEFRILMWQPWCMVQ